MTLLMREQEKFEEGRAEAILESIQKQVKILKELNIEDLIITQKIAKTYSITEEEVKKYL